MGKLSGAIVPVTPFEQNCALLFDEAFTIPMVLGLLLIVGGVALIETGSHPPAREPS